MEQSEGKGEEREEGDGSRFREESGGWRLIVARASLRGVREDRKRKFFVEKNVMLGKWAGKKGVAAHLKEPGMVGGTG